MIPTGRQLTLQHGAYAAVVTELGASLRQLTWRDRPLVVGFGQDELPIGYQGAVLAPWPNRIADGRYTFRRGGNSRQLGPDGAGPAQRPARPGRIWSPWQVDHRLTQASVRAQPSTVAAPRIPVHPGLRGRDTGWATTV